jgi:capsular exopolysaccharide synthesis family protein
MQIEHGRELTHSAVKDISTETGLDMPTTLNAQNPSYDAPRADEDAGMDLGALLAWLRRRLFTFITVAELVFAGALVYALLREPMFEAEAAVLLDQQNGVEALLELDPNAPVSPSSLNNKVEILRSTSFLERVIERNDLLHHPEFAHLVAGEPAPARSPLGQFLRRYGLSVSLDPRSWFARPPAEGERIGPSDLALQLSRHRIQATALPRTDVITVKVTATTPDHAAELANLIVEEFLVDQVQSRNEATERANEFLAERLAELREQVQQEERAVAEFAAQNKLVEEVGQSSVVDQRLTLVSEQLSQARADEAGVEARLRRLESIMANGGSPEAILEVVSSEVVESLRGQRGELRRRLSEASTRLRDGHPEMIQLREELWEVEQQLYAELERVIATVRSDLQVARERVASFERDIDALQGDQATAGVARVQLRELQRNAQSARSLYETFLNRSTEINQQSELERGSARIISPARPPEDPVGPPKTILLAMGAVLALAAGAGGAMVAEMLDGGLRTRDELEKALGISQLAAVPLIERWKGMRFGAGGPLTLVTDEPLGSFAEAIRTLRSAITIAELDQRSKAVLLTSSLPNEGKSTTAIAMARSAAEAGQRVLLVDGDLRNSRIASMMKIRDRDADGLQDVIADTATLEQAVLRDPETALHVLTSGTQKSIPTDLFGSPAFRRFLDEARTQYDLVVIDSAPILAVNDTRQAAAAVDAVIYVVAWASTPKDAAIQGLAALKDCNAPVLGAVMTMMDMNKMKRYGHGDAAFYHSRYRAYYLRRPHVTRPG